MDMVVSSSTDLICSAVGTGANGAVVGTNVEEGLFVAKNGSAVPVVLVAPPLAPMAPMAPMAPLTLVLVVLVVVVVVLLVLGKKMRAGRFALITPPHDSLFAGPSKGPWEGPWEGPWAALAALPFITVKMSHATTPSVNKTIITGPMLVALWPKSLLLLLLLLLPIPKSSK
jgi:hypothetical protein